MIKYIVKFGSYYKEVLTRGMAEILADELISQNYQGCRDKGKTAQDLISVEGRKE
jgi:hypothetical protein